MRNGAKNAALEQCVRDTMQRHRMVSAGERVGVAVSGGADSTALLLLLDELKAELGITLLAVHLNHQLRGAAADEDERFVADLAARLGIELVTVREDVAEEARRTGTNLEEAGRQLRYRAFERLCAERRATRVATGHTADDQAETVLAHLVRGTGPAGLGGIYPVAGRVVRPLLEVRRSELREYLGARGQAWREDETNEDTTRLRARIRHLLLPRLEADFEPAIVTHLASLAGLARGDEQFWSALVRERFAALVTAGAGGVSIPVAGLLAPLGPELAMGTDTERDAAQEAVTRRLVRRIVKEVRGHRRGLTSQHVEQVVRLARGSVSGRRAQLPGGVEVEREFDRLVFTCAEKEKPRGGLTTSSVQVPSAATEASGAYEYEVALAGEDGASVAIREIGRRISLKVIDWPARGSDTRSLPEALDRALLHAPMVVRNWRPGDAYRPRGRGGVRKLKRLFADRRIGARLRGTWPVLTCAGRVVWASGFPVAQEFAAGDRTRTAVAVAEEEL